MYYHQTTSKLQIYFLTRYAWSLLYKIIIYNNEILSIEHLDNIIKSIKKYVEPLSPSQWNIQSFENTLPRSPRASRATIDSAIETIISRRPVQVS